MTPHNLPTFDFLEAEESSKVLASGWVAQGGRVENFENELCDFFNLPHGHSLAVSSGSSALYLALFALDGKNKKIGLPIYTCSSLRNAINLVQGTPAYFDTKENHPNINLDLVNNIDILIAPSMYGIPIDIPSKNSYKLIEDIAQSLGARVNNQLIGLRGDIGICSFYATKMITTGGQGGAIISKDRNIIDFLRDYREFDCRRDGHFRFNFQMTDIQAAIGSVQLKKLPSFILKREKIFQIYQQEGLNLINDPNPNTFPVRYRAVMLCEKQPDLIKALKRSGIKSIIPIEEWELKDNPDHYPFAKQLTTQTISLPIYPNLSEEDVSKIIKIAKNFI